MSAAMVLYQPHTDGTLFRRRGLLAKLEQRLRALEREYERDVQRIRRFERRYRPAVGDRYDELERLRERTSRAWEALAQARMNPEGPSPESREQRDERGGTTPRPSQEARRLFLELARRIHPDFAGDEDERRRRHELMAEATLAYRENDDRRLQWLLEHWLAESDPIRGFGQHSQWSRTNRQIAWVRHRIRELQYGLGRLHSSPVARLLQEHEHARTSGRNLILEMRRQVLEQLEEAYREQDRLRTALADLAPDIRVSVEASCGL